MPSHLHAAAAAAAAAAEAEDRPQPHHKEMQSLEFPVILSYFVQ